MKQKDNDFPTVFPDNQQKSFCSRAITLPRKSFFGVSNWKRTTNSAFCSNLKGWALSLTISRFKYHVKESFRKYCEKRRKCWEPAFSPFPTMFSILYKRNSITGTMFKQLAAHCFSLETLSFGYLENIRLYQTTKFTTGPNWKNLQMTI